MIFDEPKVYMVFGAGGLIGSKIALKFLELGQQVIAIDIVTESLHKYFDKYIESDQVSIVQADITDSASIKNVFKNANAKFDKIGGAVNATYPRLDSGNVEFLDIDVTKFNRSLSDHIGGSLGLMQESLRYSKEQQCEFSLVTLSSIYGVMAPKFEIYENLNMSMPAEYAAIKAAIQHLTRYVTALSKGTQFRANCVSPGGILGGQPAEFQSNYAVHCRDKGMLDPSDIIGTVIYLSSELSRYVCGQNIIVDDGFSI